MGKRNQRHCEWCDAVIYYGLYCTNHCAELDHELWVLVATVTV